MKIAVVGAGLAGLTCANALSGAHDVRLFDKGTRAGGRMSTRMVPTAEGAASFDHGAQYFTARDVRFQAEVDRWRAEGVVAHWPAAGIDAWVGVPGMSAPVATLAARRDVAWASRVEDLARRDDRWRLTGVGVDDPFDVVIVAVPAEQVAELVGAFDSRMAALAHATRSEPCCTVMAAFAARLAIDADVVKQTGIIGWAARDSAKPGRSGPESWVIQAGPEWSTAHLEDDAQTVSSVLLTAFAARLDIRLPTPLAIAAHRWRYAKSGAAGAKCLWNPTIKLGVCGDWLIGPRIESAFLSGLALAQTIDAR